MENNTPQSGFNVQNIILLESEFFRTNQVSFDKDAVKSDMNLQVESSVSGNLINVVEAVTLSQKCGEEEQVRIKVKMVGLFEQFGNELIPADLFGRVNGAAIIFPYIREHITSLSIKAGLPPIILPTVNFANAAEVKGKE